MRNSDQKKTEKGKEKMEKKEGSGTLRMNGAVKKRNLHMEKIRGKGEINQASLQKKKKGKKAKGELRLR